MVSRSNMKKKVWKICGKISEKYLRTLNAEKKTVSVYDLCHVNPPNNNNITVSKLQNCTLYKRFTKFAN